MGQDAQLMPVISSANVACGGHAGDPGTMRRTVRLARSHGVAVGAHPGFADLVGFGRRELQMSAQDVEDLVLYQVSALAGIARSEGVRLQHVKPHGALYNMACRDEVLAEAIARAVVACDPTLVLFGLPDSALIQAGLDAGLPVAAEAFADRAYHADGSLVSAVVRRAASSTTSTRWSPERWRWPASVRSRPSTARGISFEADTLCVHGDTPGAAQLAAAIRRGLEDAGVTVARLTR